MGSILKEKCSETPSCRDVSSARREPHHVPGQKVTAQSSLPGAERPRESELHPDLASGQKGRQVPSKN